MAATIRERQLQNSVTIKCTFAPANTDFVVTTCTSGEKFTFAAAKMGGRSAARELPAATKATFGVKVSRRLFCCCRYVWLQTMRQLSRRKVDFAAAKIDLLLPRKCLKLQTQKRSCKRALSKTVY